MASTSARLYRMVAARTMAVSVCVWSLCSDGAHSRAGTSTVTAPITVPSAVQIGAVPVTHTP